MQIDTEAYAAFQKHYGLYTSYYALIPEWRSRFYGYQDAFCEARAARQPEASQQPNVFKNADEMNTSAEPVQRMNTSDQPDELGISREKRAFVDALAAGIALARSGKAPTEELIEGMWQNSKAKTLPMRESGGALERLARHKFDASEYVHLKDEVKMPKYRTKHPLKSGWTRWQQPKMKGYLMQCCGCGLIHEMEFGILRKIKDKARGYWSAVRLAPEKYRVEFRVKRYEIEDGTSK